MPRPRPLWTGAISFGLVNVPVRMFSAVREHKLEFHYVHEPDGSPIGYQKICKAEEKLVPDDEIVKAFELEEGEWVYLSDEDFEAARAAAEGGKSIEIDAFVPQSDIDPAYFDNSYYLEPESGAERPYALLARALDKTGLSGVAKIVMRDREYLAALRVRDGVIVLERMHFADEVRPPEDHAPGTAKVPERELEAAVELIERLAGDFEPERYEDSYRERLCEIIRAKRKGERVPVAEVEEPKEPEDLLAALRRSIEEAKGRRPAGRRDGGSRARRDGNGNGGGGDGDRIGELSKDELLERAKRLDIPGRSKMSKDELAKAVRRAS
ncbi:MAG TPA: Ku protein [Gaiellaceae bacterium]|nr:Ku protein [Gaiellaceae bacterium]